MAKKPTRLRFTEDDLSSASVSKAAGRADKAADKAEKAVDKLPGKKRKANSVRKRIRVPPARISCVLIRQSMRSRLRDRP